MDTYLKTKYAYGYHKPLPVCKTKLKIRSALGCSYLGPADEDGLAGLIGAVAAHGEGGVQ